MKKTTSNAVRILGRIAAGDPQLRRLIQNEHQDLEVARQSIDLRTSGGLSQRDMAARVGTTKSVISRLENAE